MERRRFKAQIDAKQIDRILNKKRKKDVEKPDPSKTPQPKILLGIPDHLLPQTCLTDRKRDIGKPENWSDTKQKKLTRKEIFKQEKLSIDSRREKEQNWNRAIRTINVALDLRQPDQVLDADDQVICKKGSLLDFFKVANSLNTELELKQDAKKRKNDEKDQSLRKIPKLAAGLDPDADEICL